MFYTLGDYRDICIDVEDDVADALEKSVYKDSSGEEKSKMTIKQLSKLIEQFLQNSGDNKESASVKKPGTPPTTPKDWWDNNAKHIWRGMICALTYKDNEAKEQPPEVDQKVRAQLWDEEGKKPKPPQYQYTEVKLEETTDGQRTNNQPTKLSDFVKIPTYFRYLEEWGETFCFERTKRLDQIYEDCKVGENDRKNGNKKCSGYGEDCEDQLEDEPTNVPSLLCPGCGIECRKYRKWINTKKTEFEKQKNAYEEQQKKCKEESEGGGNGFCKTLTTSTTAAAFLKTLGSCKKDNENGEGNKIIFDDKGDTFKHTQYCAPCSRFTVNCKNVNCDKTKGNNCNGIKVITVNNIENQGISIGNVDMVVSDKDANGFKDVLNECAGANIFKGIRKEQWKCAKVCGYVVCKTEKENRKANNEKHIITIKALLHRWLEYFLEDYNKINKKLKT
ncbi:hypothetical protein PFTANZ_06499, partial [Plasmodium falciparum Tanzania (2000708)]